MNDVVPPWLAPLTTGEHAMLAFGLLVAAGALLAMLLRLLLGHGEVSPKYRPATHAATAVVALAFLSYVLLNLTLVTGYVHRGGVWQPNDGAVGLWLIRYADWAVTIPLLVVELISVSVLDLARTRRIRAIGVTAGFLMVASGFVGGVVVEGGSSFTGLLVFGLVGAVFFGVLYVVVISTVLRSLPSLPLSARRPYRSAMVLLLVVWFVYPAAFGLLGAGHGGAWTTTEQLLLCLADIVAKVGYSVLIFRVAKLRTAADVVAGVEFHQETIWVDRVKHADAALPPSSPELARHPASGEPVDQPSPLLQTLLLRDAASDAAAGHGVLRSGADGRWSTDDERAAESESESEYR